MNESMMVKVEDVEMVPLFPVTIGTIELAIDARCIVRVEQPQRPVRIPGAPSHILGLVRCQGLSPIPLIDINQILGVPAPTEGSHDNPWLLILVFDGDHFAIAVDQSSGITLVSSDTFGPATSMQGDELLLFLKAEYDSDGASVGILDLASVHQRAKVVPA